MCWLIMVGVRRLRGDAAAVFHEHGYVAAPATNPNRVHFGDDAVKLAVSDGHCACAIFVGDRSREPPDVERLRQGYRRKGWSQGKVERAVQARVAAHESRERRRSNASPFPGVVSTLVDAGAEVSLLAHFFSGSFDDPFPVVGRERLARSDFVARHGEFPADTVVTITP